MTSGTDKPITAAPGWKYVAWLRRATHPRTPSGGCLALVDPRGLGSSIANTGRRLYVPSWRAA